MTGVYVGVRDVVSVSGPEAGAYLQGQVSQDVLKLATGASAWSFVLQPQGKVDAWFRVTRTGDDSYLLDVDAGAGPQLLSRLERFKLRTKATFELAEWALHAYEGEPSVRPEAPIVAVAADGSGLDVLAPELPEPAGEPVSFEAYEKRRILAGIPSMGAELDESTIPAESRMVDVSVDFEKGCYTGQELVARVDSRGDNTPRKLRIVSGGGSAAAGDELLVDGAGVGVLTSVAPADDGFVALAYVKRSGLSHSEAELGGAIVQLQPVPADADNAEVDEGSDA